MCAMGPVRHLEEEELERYALGKSDQKEIAAAEEHLLLCGECRQRLDDTEAFVKGTANAAQEIRKQEGAQQGLPFSAKWAWTLAAGVALFGGVFVYRSVPDAELAPATQVLLESVRGPVSRAPANQPLELRPDLSGLPMTDSYLLQLVDGKGASLWEGKLRVEAATVTIPGRPPGIYFVRVFLPDRQLLREYGLELTK